MVGEEHRGYFDTPFTLTLRKHFLYWVRNILKRYFDGITRRQIMECSADEWLFTLKCNSVYWTFYCIRWSCRYIFRLNMLITIDCSLIIVCLHRRKRQSRYCVQTRLLLQDYIHFNQFFFTRAIYFKPKSITNLILMSCRWFRSILSSRESTN